MSTTTPPELPASDLVFAPGVWDGLTARMAEQAGFAALCASGFAISASLGYPDAELFTMSENLEAVRKIREASALPLIADIDTGYGNALNAARTARRFADAGVAAVFMEDQESPKRCPICVGDPVPLLDTETAAGKIRAARDAAGGRMRLIARTDASGDEALRRAEAYVAAGADMIMPVTKTFSTTEEWAKCHEVTGVPLVATLTASAWTEKEFTPDVLREIGVRIALLPTQPLMAAAGALKACFGRLAAGEPPARVSADALPHHDFVDLIGFGQVEEDQRRYLPAGK
ncbi:isocitrate lyase/PEP mutase family protein [Amycolatopsis acidicola]|uniref:Isocitrate lyase/PEP mutase family protein n=1 Tax=Amycolatopsis acidicola TaxID=2596893 RepID=A0A5N0V0I2_9PSEU|nr:isocitrate lyase/PEP mutase family protein [Amycolatopsis acidicola]KAA9157609.1 isocitrate lyase/PEP mutase family protein [Amycolatopsis acidicola]